MNINELIKKFWGEVYPEKVIYISTYLIERYKKWNAVDTIPISFWFQKRTYKEVKEFLIARNKRDLRKEHNDRVLKQAGKGKKPDPTPPKGA